MLTKQEMHDEFWLLTKSILSDSRVDTTEARVLKRWLEEHSSGDEFAYMIEKLDRFLKDKFIDGTESSELVNSFGRILAQLSK